MIRGLGLWHMWYRPDLMPSNEGRALENWVDLATDSVKHTCIIKPQQKFGTPETWWISWLVTSINVSGGRCILSTQKLHIWDPFPSHPVCLCVGLVLICIYNKTSIVSIASFWVLWIVLENYWTWGSSGNPQIYSQLVRSMGGLETPEFVNSIRNTGSLMEDWALNLWSLCWHRVVSIRTTLQ